MTDHGSNARIFDVERVPQPVGDWAVSLKFQTEDDKRTVGVVLTGEQAITLALLLVLKAGSPTDTPLPPAIN